MKRNRLFIIMGLIIGLASAVSAYAETVPYVSKSSGVVVEAVINSEAMFEGEIKNISNNDVNPEILWDEQIVGSGWQKAKQYVEINAFCNSYSWRVDIYTNNINADPSVLQKGGLFSTTDNTNHLPVAWVVSDSLAQIENIGEPSELLKNAVETKEGTKQAGWTYIKGQNDCDDPNTTAWTEDWQTAYNGGYTTVLWGNQKDAYLPYGYKAVSPVYVYFEADFTYSEGAMDYEGTIYFDFIAQ